MNKKYSKEFKKGLAFGAGFVLIVLFAAFLLSKTEIVTGDQGAIKEGVGMEHMASGCSAMHAGMGEMASMSIEEMDKDKDGLCDMCGMPVEQCKEMHNSGKGMMHSMDDGYPAMHNSIN